MNRNNNEWSGSGVTKTPENPGEILERYRERIKSPEDLPAQIVAGVKEEQEMFQHSLEADMAKIAERVSGKEEAIDPAHVREVYQLARESREAMERAQDEVRHERARELREEVNVLSAQLEDEQETVAEMRRSAIEEEIRKKNLMADLYEHSALRESVIERGRKMILKHEAGGGNIAYGYEEILSLFSDSLDSKRVWRNEGILNVELLVNKDWGENVLQGEDIVFFKRSKDKDEEKYITEVSLSREEKERIASLEEMNRTITEYEERDISAFALGVRSALRREYVAKQRSLQEEKEKIADMLARKIRKEISIDTMMCFVHSDDAEVLDITDHELCSIEYTDDEARELLERKGEATKRAKAFIDELQDITGLSSDRTYAFDEVNSMVFEKLMLEEADEKGREKYHARQERRKKRKEFQESENPLESTLEDPGYKYFDPENEFERIRSFARSPEISPWQYRVRKEDYQANKAEYTKGRIMLDGKLEEVLLREGEFNDERRKELEDIIVTHAEEIKLSPRDKKRYGLFFDKVAERNREMDEVQGDLKPENGAEILFEKLFGFTPEGEVLIKRGPVSFFVEIRNENDYVKAYGQDGAKSSGGFNREFVSVVRNDGEKRSQEQVDSTYMHEGRHALHANIKELMSELRGEEPLSPATAPEDVPEYVKKFSAQSQERVKDEIFAFLKDGSTVEFAQRWLEKSKSEGGLYDYFKKREEWIEKNWKNKEIKDALKNALEKEKSNFEDVRSKAIDIVERLEGIGTTRAQIIALFNTVPLAKWGAEVRRLEDEGVFANMRRQSLFQQEREKERLEEGIRKRQTFPTIRRLLADSRMGVVLPKAFRNRLEGDRKFLRYAENTIARIDEQIDTISQPFR